MISGGREFSNYERLGARFSHRGWARNPEMSSEIVELASGLPNGRWLDVGCGPGDFSDLLSRPKVSLYGMDLSRRMLQALKESAREVAAIQGDAHALPLRDEEFGVAACRNLLKHCRDPSRVLLEMVRVTRPKGKFLIVESCALGDDDRRFMDEVITISEPGQSPYRTPTEWAELVRQASIEVCTQKVFPHHVVSTPDYRREQFGLDDQRLRAHWNRFSTAPPAVRRLMDITQSDDGVLRFSLFWTAILGAKEGR
ncbi:MAG: methyltransferase domain-containing protein [Actinomycetota bacterium]|nr:methyltransferase domain-containing protein [Actinomycetota bacterium]